MRSRVGSCANSSASRVWRWRCWWTDRWWQFRGDGRDSCSRRRRIAIAFQPSTGRPASTGARAPRASHRRSRSTACFRLNT